jgi:hypothetical protein
MWTSEVRLNSRGRAVKRDIVIRMDETMLIVSSALPGILSGKVAVRSTGTMQEQRNYRFNDPSDVRICEDTEDPSGRQRGDDLSGHVCV